jgi:hypothetical protein
LTAKELQYIKEELRKRKDEVSPENLLNQSRRISIDTLYSFLKHQKIQTYVYTFMRPIFIREGKWCLFYVSRICEFECIYEEAVFLHLEKGSWTRRVKIFSKWDEPGM